MFPHVMNEINKEGVYLMLHNSEQTAEVCDATEAQ